MITLLLGLVLGVALSIGCFVIVPYVSHRSRLGPGWHTHTDRLLSEAECCPTSVIQRHYLGQDRGVVVEIDRLKLVAGGKCQQAVELQFDSGRIPLTRSQKTRVRRIAMDRLSDHLSTVAVKHLLGTGQEKNSQGT